MATVTEPLNTGNYDELNTFTVESGNNNVVQTVWIPQCKDEYKPRLNQVFQNYDDAVAFYTNYGRQAGFDVRLTIGKTYKDGVVTFKYIVCNRAGTPHAGSVSNKENVSETKSVRMTKSGRCQCPARIALKFFGQQGYKIVSFYEEHNHEMVPENARHLLKCNRNMNFLHKNFVFDCSNVSIGSSKAHRFMRQSVGDYANIGATQTDFRNFQRDIRSYIGKKDADMIIDKFSNKSQISDGAFYYQYKVDEEGHLSGLFWADPIGRRQFQVYYDVLSVDATYDTNCYSMVFIPFTGVDNHWRSVTFAAALISKEDVGHYRWIFQAFHKAMGRSPKCIITDQDPSMAATIPEVLSGATHRLCMWHIMKKLHMKVGPAICSKTDFMDRINSIIWNEFITQSDFAIEWDKIIVDFGLQDNKWLHDMYEKRTSWIPAFFKDVFMLGLLRSTSRSESANNYFSFFLKPGDTLCEFYMHYESAVEKQRHTHIQLTKDSTYMPKLLTPKKIEKDAANIYTHEIFRKVQEEISKSCYHLAIIEVTTNDDVKIFKIKDGYYKNMVFEVQVKQPSYSGTCSCNMYLRLGFMCSHLFAALNSCTVDKIPADLICNRWVKNAEARHDSLHLDEIHIRDDKADRLRRKVSNIWFNFQAAVSAAGMDEEKIDSLDEKVKDLIPSPVKTKKKKGVRLNDEIIEQLVGSKSDAEVVIQPPLKSRNKGCGKRILSPAELNAKERVKGGRKCCNCGAVGSGHDSLEHNTTEISCRCWCFSPHRCYLRVHISWTGSHSHCCKCVNFSYSFVSLYGIVDCNFIYSLILLSVPNSYVLTCFNRAAASLYSSSYFAQGKFGNGNQYTADLTAVIGLSGCLHCSRNSKEGTRA